MRININFLRGSKSFVSFAVCRNLDPFWGIFTFFKTIPRTDQAAAKNGLQICVQWPQKSPLLVLNSKFFLLYEKLKNAQGGRLFRCYFLSVLSIALVREQFLMSSNAIPKQFAYAASEFYRHTIFTLLFVYIP